MKQHKGKIVEEAIKKSGYQMKALAKKLGIARNTLYTKLKDADLEDIFITRVGNVICYNFSIDFPNLADREAAYMEESSSIYREAKSPDYVQLQELTKRYVNLLEDYNNLLKILILLANSNELVGIKKEITEFLEREEKEEK